MQREQGSRVSSGQFRSLPLSICVLQISPWMISLNIPSPPTHTTLQRSRTSSHVPLTGALRRRSDWRFLTPHPSNFFSSASVFRWSLAWLAYSVTMATDQTLVTGAAATKKTNKKKTHSGQDKPMTCVRMPACANSGATFSS